MKCNIWTRRCPLCAANSTATISSPAANTAPTPAAPPTGALCCVPVAVSCRCIIGAASSAMIRLNVSPSANPSCKNISLKILFCNAEK